MSHCGAGAWQCGWSAYGSSYLDLHDDSCREESPRIALGNLCSLRREWSAFWWFGGVAEPWTIHGVVWILECSNQVWILDALGHVPPISLILPQHWTLLGCCRGFQSLDVPSLCTKMWAMCSCRDPMQGWRWFQLPSILWFISWPRKQENLTSAVLGEKWLNHGMSLFKTTYVKHGSMHMCRRQVSESCRQAEMESMPYLPC